MKMLIFPRSWMYINCPYFGTVNIKLCLNFLYVSFERFTQRFTTNFCIFVIFLTKINWRKFMSRKWIFSNGKKSSISDPGCIQEGANFLSTGVAYNGLSWVQFPVGVNKSILSLINPSAEAHRSRINKIAIIVGNLSKCKFKIKIVPKKKPIYMQIV